MTAGRVESRTDVSGGAALPRPIIAIVGRPNVGKSTLFNRLVGQRRALVRDVPGVTRDRLYGQVAFERWQATVIDTGGFDPSSEEPLIEGVRRQVLAAVDEADLVLFVVDARAGVTALDAEIAGVLRRSERIVVLAANKVDAGGQESALAELYALGFGEPVPVSAEHGRGVAEMLEVLRARTPVADLSAPPANAVHLAVIGRPNVGKSSLVNMMIGAERVLVHDAPGTTRDAVDTAFERDGRPYVLVDTAGIRRKGRVSETLEKLAVVMALRSLERCQVALLVMDASEGLTAQDAHIGGYAHEAGRAVVLVVNKWDLVPPGMVRKAEVVEQLRERLPFVDYAPICFTSATTGEGVRELFQTVDQVAAEARRRVSTGDRAPAHFRAG
jgi:GTPase